MYLLDTTTVSDYLRKDPRVIENIHRTNPKYIAISTVTSFEIAYGLEKKPSLYPFLQPQIDALYRRVTIADFDFQAAITAAKIKNSLISNGLNIGMADILIAAIALSKGWIVITSNTKHFSLVDNLNWQSARTLSLRLCQG